MVDEPDMISALKGIYRPVNKKKGSEQKSSHDLANHKHSGWVEGVTEGL